MRNRGQSGSVSSRTTRILLCVGLPTLSACGLLFPTALLDSVADGGPDSAASDGGGGGGGSDRGDMDAEGGAVSTEASSGTDAVSDAGSDAGSDAANDAASDAPSDGAGGDGACQASIATDPLNCGACGHDCLGGACEAGVCGPVAIVSGEPAPAYIATDGTKVYWTDVGTGGTSGIFSAATDGSNKTPVLTPLAFANQLALKGSLLFYDCEFNGSVGVYDLGSGTNTTYAG